MSQNQTPSPKIKSYFDQMDLKISKLLLSRQDHDELKQIINACYVGIQNEYAATSQTADRLRKENEELKSAKKE